MRALVGPTLAATGIFGLSLLPLACPTSGVGDPCIPEDEYRANFRGFTLKEENIESRSFQCQTRLCLVNHFQGRVSCPFGQLAPTLCDGPGDGCVASHVVSVPQGFGKDKCSADEDCATLGGKCNTAGGFCECSKDEDCATAGPEPYRCVGDDSGKPTAAGKQCTLFVKATGDDIECQSEGDAGLTGTEAEEAAKKSCCIPGADVPVSTGVCPQCDQGDSGQKGRNAENAVFCSCRCLLDGEEEDADTNYCDCPDGFQCSEIRKDIGLGDKQIAGGYCIPQDTQYDETRTVCNRRTAGNYPDGSCQAF